MENPDLKRRYSKDKSALRVGFCPIGKFVFSHEDALRHKLAIAQTLSERDIKLVDLDDVLPNNDGLVRDINDVAKVIKHFGEHDIDALLLPHCNFGTEHAAGLIARDCGVPVLLWAPRDPAPQPDGTRLRDSLCGSLATSKVLHTLGVPFSYLPNEPLEHPEVQSGFDRFFAAAAVVKRLKGLRIGQIGQRIDFFWCTIVDERELLDRFGVEVQPIDLISFLREVRGRLDAQRDVYRAELDAMRPMLDIRCEMSEDGLLSNFAFRDVALEWAERESLDVLSVQTFASIPDELGAFQCLAASLLADAGLPVAMESDIHGAISLALIEAASTKDELPFLPDITSRHPDNDNAVLLWHPEAPLGIREAGAKVTIDRPWILEGLPPGMVGFPLKHGPLTLCRFDGGGGAYRLGVGEGRMVDGPYTREYYGWMEVDDWPRWERQLIEGPYIHHAACIHDHVAEALIEATRFIPRLEAERFGASSASDPWHREVSV